MNAFAEKRSQALETCEKVMEGIENGTTSVSASLLMCKRIARLVNDLDGQEQLNYEYGGYPRADDGFVLHKAWEVGAMHGRLYKSKNKDGSFSSCIFTELCGELEANIESSKKAIGNYTTQGYSVSGDLALLATDRLTVRVHEGTNILLQNIQTAERRLSILKSQYYDYASKWQIELQFGNTAKSVFEMYQERVDRYYSALPTSALQKLNTIEELLEDNNPEHYAQILTSCRRLWTETAKTLFNEVLPNYTGKLFKTRSGKDIDISGDHDNNKLSAVIETLQTKAARNTLVGSETIYLVDWMEQINNAQSAGVHHEVTRDQAMRCIIHTYIVLGDILSLKANVDNVEQHNFPIIDLDNEVSSRLALVTYTGLEIGHTRLFNCNWGIFLP